MFRRRQKPDQDGSAPFLGGVLRDARLDPSVDERKFTRGVLRRHRVESGRRSLQYWTPAIAGATIASIALLALLQMLSQSEQLPAIRVLNGDAASNTPSRNFVVPSEYRSSNVVR